MKSGAYIITKMQNYKMIWDSLVVDEGHTDQLR